MHHKPY